MSEFSKLFFPDNKPVLKTTFTVNDEDYDLIRRCFPEHGFLQYAPGLFFKLLADELRKRNITNAYDRSEHPDFANVPRLVSHIDIAFTARRAHVRSGVGKLRDAASLLRRLPPDAFESCSQGSGNKDEEREEKVS